MFTICWIASSCPIISRCSPFSSCVASFPVLLGSSGTLSRTIFSTAFRLCETASSRGLCPALPSEVPSGFFCRGSIFHKLPGKLIAIPLDAPSCARILRSLLLSSTRLRSHVTFTSVCFRGAGGLGRTHFHPADQRSLRHVQH